jgi:hypothetical protein
MAISGSDNRRQAIQSVVLKSSGNLIERNWHVLRDNQTRRDLRQHSLKQWKNDAMKTFWLTMVLMAAGTPVMAHDWNYGTPSRYRSANYHNGSSHQNHGGLDYSNGFRSGIHGSGFNHNSGYRRIAPMHDHSGYRLTNPVLPSRGTYDPIHGDFHPNINNGYGSPLNQPGFSHRHRGHNDYIRY